MSLINSSFFQKIQKMEPSPPQEDKTVVDRNLRSISAIDPFAAEILAQSVHVALYDFDLETKSWKRSDVAGPFFVYKRKAKVSIKLTDRPIAF
jgi:hypothetical protein